MVKLYKYELLSLVRSCLMIFREYGELHKELSMEEHCPMVTRLIMKCMRENRWNNITHKLIEKIVCLMATPEYFRKKETFIGEFLEFLMEYFVSKKYIFLTSTRMCSQGDTKVVYHICKRIAIVLEKIGGNMQYPTWNSFLINKLKIELQDTGRNSTIQLTDSQDYEEHQ